MGVPRRTFLGGLGTIASGVVLGQGAGPTADTSPFGGGPGSTNAKPFFGDKGKPSGSATQTKALAAHSVSVQYSDLDAETVRKAKHRVLDMLGCLIGGAPASGNHALVDLVRSEAGPPEASIIGYGLKASAAQAALVNAVISRSYDFEVMTVVAGNRIVGSHHSPTTSMTALALCEHAGASGEDFITALVVADDIAARTLAASGSDLGLGWDGASIYTAIPAAAIASRLLGLSAQQTQDAFGLVIDLIGGTHQADWDGATDWKLHQGLSARGGIFAAKLAKRGWVGIGDALLAPFGFYGLFTDGCEHPELLTESLGKVFYAEEYFKPFPACMAAHTTIECAIALKKTNRLAAADIDKILVKVPPGLLASALGKPFNFAARYPMCEANFSIPFQAANALLHGSVRPEHYADAAIRSKDLGSLIRKVALAPLTDGSLGVEIEVTTRGGGQAAGKHSGTPDRFPGVNPFSYEEIVAKFRQQVAFSNFVPGKSADEIVARVDALEKEKNISDLVSLLAGSRLG